MTNSTLLTVAEFCNQPEVNRYPSQVYGWIKRGMPYEEVGGKKMIPFADGLAWIQSRVRAKGNGKPKGLKISVVDEVPEGGTHEAERTYRPSIDVGDWLEWQRGNNLGSAYGLVQKFTDSLVQIAVDYRTTPVWLVKAQVERDVSKGVVKLCHPNVVRAGVLEKLAQLDFLMHMLEGPEAAKQMRKCMIGLMPQDVVDRFNEDGFRRPISWPNWERRGPYGAIENDDNEGV